MKACIYIKRAKRGRGRGQTLALLKHCGGEGRSAKEIDDGQSRVAAMDAYGLAGGVDTAKMGELRDNLLRQHHGGRSKELSKHLVISCEDTLDPAARRAAIRILRRVAKEFLRVYAPGCSALAFAHNDRLHPHIHLVISNSNGEKSLHWTPNELRRMQSMEWLAKDLQTALQSGRKKSRKAIRNPYPGAKLTLAAELAAMPADELEKISWVKRGNTRVFTYKNRRVRERLIERERQQYENAQRYNGTDEHPAESQETSGRPGIGNSTADGGRNQPAPATGSDVADGNSMGDKPANALNRALAQTLQKLQKERGQRRVEFPSPEIK
jgi:hypothetical protein